MLRGLSGLCKSQSFKSGSTKIQNCNFFLTFSESTSLCGPAPNYGGLIAGSHPSVAPGDLCGVYAT
eukprot:2293262-Prorocentrum_lima.AAC.1